MVVAVHMNTQLIYFSLSPALHLTEILLLLLLFFDPVYFIFPATFLSRAFKKEKKHDCTNLKTCLSLRMHFYFT